jgi:hypothetical protein
MKNMPRGGVDEADEKEGKGGRRTIAAWTASIGGEERKG